MLRQILSGLDARQRYEFGRSLLAVAPFERLEEIVREAPSKDAFIAAASDLVALLDDWNEIDRAIAWRRELFSAGSDPYLVTDIVTRVWERQDGAAAREECSRLAAILDSSVFSLHGDDFHKDQARKILIDLDRVVSYEMGSGEEPEVVAQDLHDAVRGIVWPRLWQLARVNASARQRLMARLFPYAYRLDAQHTLYAIEYFLAPGGHWVDCHELLEKLADTDIENADVLAQVLRWRAEIAMALADRATAIACLHRLSGLAGAASSATARVRLQTIEVLWRLYHPAVLSGIDDIQWLRAAALGLRNQFGDLGAEDMASVRLTLLLAHIEEDLGDIDAAAGHYLHCTNADPGSYLPGAFWRAMTFLVSRGRWAEAARIHDRGVLALWPLYGALARTSPAERYLVDGETLPDSAVMLNCDGIGDDLWRILISIRFKGLIARYAFVVDDRLKAPLERSLPQLEFLTRTRTVGSHAVSEDAYKADRVGVHASVESTRLTRAIQDRIAAYGEVCLTEDAYSRYFRCEGVFPHALPVPVLTSDPLLKENARRWLASLPGGRRNIGLSWRTAGTDEDARNRNHFRIDELGDLFAIEGVNWIVLQYTVTEEEIARAGSLFGVVLHLMPGIDLKDDIDAIIGLGCALDLMIATPSTIEPLMGAAGVPVVTLSAGYYSVNQYRVCDDGETDRVLPNITLLTQRKYGDKPHIVAEAVRRVHTLLNTCPLTPAG